ncbi:MTH1187 family thiamine-binding protein [Alteribacillus sp. JSM 102045]|uniref:MTH1187 family thiamine-binding protein n=1 Tax=Alteribacillus sp. JSM 102045 TaxID=1562101 RepID=UPI0035C194FC
MKGLSYQNGVLFFGSKYIGWASVKNNKPVSEVLPFNSASMLKIALNVFKAMPAWYKTIFFIWAAAVLVPPVFHSYEVTAFPELPFYTFIYFLLGTHFIFPKQLKMFHGAEHKVFSFKGVKKRRNIYRIKKANITNRYCSTNIVVMYFLTVLIFTPFFYLWYSIEQAAAIVSYSAVVFVPILHRIIQRKKMSIFRKPILGVSYAVQRRITCSHPERIHLLTAVEAYRALAEKEFPYLLKEKPKKKKEEKKMAIIDITVVPVGTESTSMSEDVAEIQKVLEMHSEKIDFQLTSMSTIVEGDLKDLFPIVQELHEIPFNRGAKRVTTNIRLDDRRDTGHESMKGKVNSVENKMN